jgi:hypothetical protein
MAVDVEAGPTSYRPRGRCGPPSPPLGEGGGHYSPRPSRPHLLNSMRPKGPVCI